MSTGRRCTRCHGHGTVSSRGQLVECPGCIGAGIITPDRERDLYRAELRRLMDGLDGVAEYAFGCSVRGEDHRWRRYLDLVRDAIANQIAAVNLDRPEKRAGCDVADDFDAAGGDG